ncbi:TatD family hydrolase [Shewanella sp. NIFS-20-20]|uniref:TatD family hydrolase n=1 Tax=Shewanella sp. NIFS-20-20 TaxID=2853806 RepID=UPI001C488EFD|nr:TatD family hydrolase [Shewanella sp. NIFS-20-20]MBV7314927.1 TatD family hydrolase [Shewanella sp. NIFS-20-20]
MCVVGVPISAVAVVIDSHAHLDMAAFDHCREQLVVAMAERGIAGVLLPGICPSSWQQQIAVAQQYQWPYALGIHPWYIQGDIDTECDKLQGLIEQQLKAPTDSAARLVAIGEVGLDKLHGTIDSQLPWLHRQISLAQQHHLPLVLHCVKAHHILLPILKQARLSRGGVIHGFSGSQQTANAYIALGFKLGIGGVILRQNADKLRSVVAALPLTSLLLETDSPSMGIVAGELNTPLILPDILAEIARLHKSSTVPVREQLFVNVTQLFDL